jgi:hypothetical protein
MLHVINGIKEMFLQGIKTNFEEYISFEIINLNDFFESAFYTLTLLIITKLLSQCLQNIIILKYSYSKVTFVTSEMLGCQIVST